MKIIALTPVKNEEWIIETFIKAMKKVADEIIILDDNSTDNTPKICENNNVVLIKNTDIKPKSGWLEFEIRNKLLQEGRKRGGTHFICLDADELITSDLVQKIKSNILKLQPNQRILLRWITLWGNLRTERVDKSFNNLYKDFIFCDDKNLNFKYAFLGVARTPKNNKTKDIKIELGGILHLQNININKSKLKQAWYMCSELIGGKRNAKRVNNTYAESIDPKNVITLEVKTEYIRDISINNLNPNIESDWRFKEIINWFNQYGVEFFEPLNIWQIKELRNLFIEKVGREPKPKMFPKWLILLNNIKNNIKNL